MLWFSWVLWLVVVVADLRLERESGVFGCENQRNHQEGEWESRSVRKKDKKRKV